MNKPDEKKRINWPVILVGVLIASAYLIVVFLSIHIIKTLNDMPTVEPTVVNIPEIEETIPVVETETATETVVETVSEPSEPPVTTEPIPSIDPIEREMMAIVIYQEAGGDAHCDDCRRRVADVVLNRVADPRFPDSIEEVLTQYAQYGLLWKTGVQWQARANNPNERHAVERAYGIAEDVLKGNHSELYGKGYVYQAEFIQGTTYIYCCGHYFGR